MKRLDFHFDYSCPWCYIGAFTVRELAAEGVDIAYHGWKMPPNANPPAKPDGYREGATARLRELRTEMNVIVSSPVQSETELALVATKLADEYGQAAGFVERVFRAHWAEKKDISNASVLVAIAEELGVNGEEFHVRLADGAGRAAYEADLAIAAARNIDSIPSYLSGDAQIIIHHYNDMPSLEALRELVK